MIVNNNNLANNKGQLIVLSGPSGAGKGTVIKNVMSRYDNLRYSISVTTRAMRVGEVEGINYYYKSVEEFKRLIEQGAFLEYQEVYGNYYGTLKGHVDNLIHDGVDVLLEIDTKGALNVKIAEPDAVMIFLVPKDGETLSTRLIGRGTESQADLTKRLSAAHDEINHARQYDYIVVNDDADRCADDILTIINAEKSRIKKCLNFIDNFK